MLFAAYRDTGYNVMLFIHILAVIVAFAPNFVWPFVSVKLKKQGKQQAGSLVGDLASGATATVHGPALAVAGIAGFGLVGMSGKAYEFADPFISAAMLVWFILLGVVFGLMLPAQKKAAAGEADADKLVSMAGGIMHLLLAVELYLMIFKPGL